MVEFPVNSRYHGIGTNEYTSPDGRTWVYLQRRLLPQSGRLQVLEEHTVQDKERLDHIAGRHFADPEMFWRICDANDAMRPEELTETVGRRLRITTPEGFPGLPL